MKEPEHIKAALALVAAALSTHPLANHVRLAIVDYIHFLLALLNEKNQDNA